MATVKHATWYDEEQVEEVLDDEPMRITGRIFLGSIDAARNRAALKRLRIGGVLALLGKGEAEAAVSTQSTASIGYNDELLSSSRIAVEIEDSKDVDLLRMLPGILAELEKLVAKAERDDTNVLVHCIAGRSRSVSVVTAWMLVSEPKKQSVQDVVDRIRLIRPWIEINPSFLQDLHLFHAVMQVKDGSMMRANDAMLLTDRSCPRLDFGANLVDMILRGTKAITMRLLSDVKGDRNSDLGAIFSHSVVVATTATTASSPTRLRFAYLRIDRIETQELSALDQATLRKSGFDSTEETLAVLKQFYPNVTATTPLLIVHFYDLYPLNL